MSWWALLDASGRVEQQVSCPGAPWHHGTPWNVCRIVEIEARLEGDWRRVDGVLVEDIAGAEALAVERARLAISVEAEWWQHAVGQWHGQYRRLARDPRWADPDANEPALLSEYPAFEEVAAAAQCTFAEAVAIVGRQLSPALGTELPRAAALIVTLDRIAEAETAEAKRAAAAGGGEGAP